MNLRAALPWIIAAVSLCVSGWSLTRSAPAPAPAPAAPVIVHREEAAAPAVITQTIDEVALRRIVQEAVAEARDAEASSERHVEDPDPMRQAMERAVVAEGHDLLDDIMARGAVTVEDREMLRGVLRELPKEQAAPLLSAYFQALNRGDIVVDGPPL
ncbi:MAG: hypothetical protein AAFV53_32690 [Myxococcota bacterium]